MAGRLPISIRPVVVLRLFVVACALLTSIAVFLASSRADALVLQVDPNAPTTPDTEGTSGAPLPGTGAVDDGGGAGAPLPGTDSPEPSEGSASAPIPGGGGSGDTSGGASAPVPGTIASNGSQGSAISAGSMPGSGVGQTNTGALPPRPPVYTQGVQAASAPDPFGTNDVTQQIGGGVVGTAYANSGFNTALNRSITGNTFAGSGLFDPLSAISNSSAGTSTIGSGLADARGSYSSSGIHQQVVAYTDDTGTIDILQVALVINIGVSHATSGQNTGLGLGHGATGTVPAGSVNPNSTSTQQGTSVGVTGDSSAVGERGNTALYQGAKAGGGDAVDQSATLVNIGIGIGNTGFNIVIGNISIDATPTATAAGESGWATTIRTGDSDIDTGFARATGNMSTSDVTQIAIASAFNGGQLSLTQQAFVINFGFALANSGSNVGIGDIGGGEVSAEQQSLANAVLAALIPLIGGTVGTDPTPTGSQLGGQTYEAHGSSDLDTGDATALGNDTRTRIVQRGEGTVSDGESATINQQALVGNFGFALSNTGANAGIGNVEPDAVGSVSATTLAVQNQLTGFLGLLTNPAFLHSTNPQAKLDSVIDLGVAALTLSGDISAADLLATWDSSLPAANGLPFAGLRVRQVSAVLDIGIAFADSGGNTAIGIYSNHKNHIAPQGSVGDDADADSSEPGEIATNTDVTITNGRVGFASVDTGDALAIGSNFALWVCQREMVDASFCARPAGTPDEPDPTPGRTPAPAADVETPVVIPSQPVVVIPQALPEVQAAHAGARDFGDALPFTGTGAATAAAAGFGMLAVGGMALVASRRRRTDGSLPASVESSEA